MYKIEAIVREEKYEEIKEILNDIGVHGITVTQVMGCGMQKGYEHYEHIVRGTKVDINMLPKIKFEIIMANKELTEKTIEAIRKTAFTGKIGDGKIFMYQVHDVVRISTGQRGAEAIC
jgi:nitrogen regulatory protein P-II 1